MKSLLSILSILLLFSVKAFPQDIIIEDFNSYTPNAYLVGQGGWYKTLDCKPKVKYLNSLSGNVAFSDDCPWGCGSSKMYPFPFTKNTCCSFKFRGFVSDGNGVVCGSVVYIQSNVSVVGFGNIFKIEYGEKSRMFLMTKETYYLGDSLDRGKWYIMRLDVNWAETDDDIHYGKATFWYKVENAIDWIRDSKLVNIPLNILDPTLFDKLSIRVDFDTDLRGMMDDISYQIKPQLNASIQSGNNNSICNGDSILLTAIPNTSEYKFKWSTGETSKSILVTAKGKYSVQVTELNGCSGVAELQINEYPKPAPAITQSNNGIGCSIDSVLLSADMGYNTYNWSTGETVRVITIKKSGKYFLEVTDSNGCFGSTEIDVIEFSKPSTSILKSKDKLFCSTDSIMLTATPDFAQYLWSTGETTKTIIVRKSGTYTVKVIDKNGCEAFAEIDIERDSSAYQIEILDIAGEPPVLNFDSTTIGLIICKNIKIKNTTENSISISSVDLAVNLNFSIPMSQFPMIILPNTYKEITVCFTASSINQFADTILFRGICDKKSLLLKGTSKAIRLSGTSECDVDIRILQKNIKKGTTNLSLAYPNPSNSKIFVDFIQDSSMIDPQIDCLLFDSYGNKSPIIFKIEDSSMNNIGKNKRIVIDTDMITNGLYNLAILLNNEYHTFSVIINR